MMVRQIAVTSWRYGTGRCESYASRRGWTMALQVREVNSWAAWREAREKVWSRSPSGDRSGAGVAPGRWGRSVTDLLATLQELEHPGVDFVSLTEAGSVSGGAKIYRKDVNFPRLGSDSSLVQRSLTRLLASNRG
jgi:hypothetical protein